MARVDTEFVVVMEIVESLEETKTKSLSLVSPRRSNFTDPRFSFSLLLSLVWLLLLKFD